VLTSLIYQVDFNDDCCSFIALIMRSLCYQVYQLSKCLRKKSLAISHEPLLDCSPTSGESPPVPTYFVTQATTATLGPLTDIGAAADGTVWGVNAVDDIFRYNWDSDAAD
jgi:hypothetical protein